MDNKKTITIIILGLVAMAGILLFLFLPSKSHLANIDFYVYDTNDNFHYEVNERLELLVNDTAAIKGKRLIWEMGNGDTLMRNTDVSYTYRKAGKYLITLKIDGKHSVNKYIKVISGLEHEAIDSIPRINGVSEGYQGEELVFSAEGYGMDTWLWEFGESGTVDAYEQQVVYSYDIPGEYTIITAMTARAISYTRAAGMCPFRKTTGIPERKDGSVCCSLWMMPTTRTTALRPTRSPTGSRATPATSGRSTVCLPG